MVVVAGPILNSIWINGSVDIFKVYLVAKRFSQTYGIDYFETFSTMARLNSIRILFSLTRVAHVPIGFQKYFHDLGSLYGAPFGYALKRKI